LTFLWIKKKEGRRNGSNTKWREERNSRRLGDNNINYSREGSVTTQDEEEEKK
jgi:hypothetical protein